MQNYTYTNCPQASCTFHEFGSLIHLEKEKKN